MNKKLLSVWEFYLLGIVTGIVALVGSARVAWHTKYYPGVSIAQVQVAGLTRDQARELIKQKATEYQVKLEFNGSEWVSEAGIVDYDLEQSLNEAYRFGRRMVIDDYLLLLIAKKVDYPLFTKAGKTQKLEQLIQEIGSSIEIAPVDPVISLAKDQIKINNGHDGIMIDSELLDQKLNNVFEMMNTKSVQVPTKAVKKELNTEELQRLKQRAETLIGDGLELRVEDHQIKLKDVELIGFLNTSKDVQEIDSYNVTTYINGLAESINVEPQNAKFEISSGKVKEFLPSKDGLAVRTGETVQEVERAILELLKEGVKKAEAEIIVERTPPEVTTDEVNKLGINERIGRGESYYAHSIPNRIYNVALASSRVNSTLIPPGEEVSFNKLVGEVSSATGYRPAYIIQAGRTVLGDGGGLCQVSTTMFRAAMNAGLPIIERWGHAYRVSYYELNSKPGVDATVIAPSKDFRFVNDTPGHILIQTINNPKTLHLVIEIYGTSDGRVATVTEPKVWGITPPLPTIYQDDPTLPTGTLKQVDWAASGAKTSFEYKVIRDGETLQDKTFTTAYRPWASVFMRGTGSSFAQ